MENTNTSRLADASGYLADTLKIVMEALNATGILKLTKGAGTKDDSGTWNGVIGVVVRGVSVVIQAVTQHHPSVGKAVECSLVLFNKPFLSQRTICQGN